MSISNWRFWQSVAISWKNLRFIVKILKVSGWVFSCYVSAVIFLDGPWLLTDSAGDRLLFSSSVKYARTLLFSWRVQSKSNQKLSHAWSCLRFRLCHLSAFPNRSKAVLNGLNLLYFSFYSDDIYNYEVCISLLKADKMIFQKDRLCFFMHDVIFGMVKSHVNNGVLWLQWYESRGRLP